VLPARPRHLERQGRFRRGAHWGSGENPRSSSAQEADIDATGVLAAQAAARTIHQVE